MLKKTSVFDSQIITQYIYITLLSNLNAKFLNKNSSLKRKAFFTNDRLVADSKLTARKL